MATALVSLADVKIHLNITGVTHDAELQAFIDAAAVVIEGKVGPIDTATYTQTFECNGSQRLALSRTQVTAVSSLTKVRDGSSPMTLGDLVIDAQTGIVRSKTQYFPIEPFNVTYTVGRTAPFPANIVMACKIIVANLWETQTARSRDDELLPGAAYLVPYRAEALLAASAVPFGYA